MGFMGERENNSKISMPWGVLVHSVVFDKKTLLYSKTASKKQQQQQQQQKQFENKACKLSVTL